MNIVFQFLKSFKTFVEDTVKICSVFFDVLVLTLLCVFKGMEILDGPRNNFLVSHSEKSPSFGFDNLAVEILLADDFSLDLLVSTGSDINKDLNGVVKSVKNIWPGLIDIKSSLLSLSSPFLTVSVSIISHSLSVFMKLIDYIIDIFALFKLLDDLLEL